jgi:orotate phosphoribosyltransferase
MKDFQKDFLEFVIANNILRFGEFTLKSGRVSPYFFNAGLFNTGSKLAFLANCYAAAIADLETDYDVLFGPAYKGIPLAATTALALATQHGIDKPYCFNRKEAKAHGEGGSIVGAELRDRVLIIDDVITAGTAVREAVEIIQGAGAELASIAVAMDRQEKGAGSSSAIQEIEQAYGIEIAHIISLQNIIDFLQAADDSALSEHLPAVEKYREKYGV